MFQLVCREELPSFLPSFPEEETCQIREDASTVYRAIDLVLNYMFHYMG